MGWIYRKIILPGLLAVLRIPMRNAFDSCVKLNQLTESQLKSYQLRRLKSLIKKSDLFSNEIIDKVEESKSISEALENLPVITKSDLRKWSQNKGLMKSVVIRETAGTTGTPMSFQYTKSNIAHQLAVRAYCLSKLGIKYGEREARLWGRRDNSIKSKLRDFILNRMVFNFIDGDSKSLAKKLIFYKPAYIYGYSSIVLAAAKYFDLANIKPPKIKAVICTAESLQGFQQDYIARVFSCPVVMEYGCTEVDIIAFQCEKRHYHLVNPWLIVEVEKGETIVTDLNQDIMPIIRYKVGDNIVFEKWSGGCGYGEREEVVTKVKGRSLNQKVYLPDGGYRHAVIFAYVAEDLYRNLPFFTQFLVVQVSINDFRFYLEAAKELDESEKLLVSSEIKELYKKYAGYSAKFEVVYSLPDRIGRGSKFDYFYSELSDKDFVGAVI